MATRPTDDDQKTTLLAKTSRAPTAAPAAADEGKTIRLPSAEELAGGDVEDLVRLAATRLAIQRFHERAPHPLRFLTSALVPYHVVAAAQERPIMPAQVAEEVTASGFKKLGQTHHGVVRQYREVWSGPAGITQLHGSDRAYQLITHFDDGSCVLTWSGAPQTPSAEGLVSLPGTGTLARDYEIHLVAVQQQVDAGRRPLYVDDIATSVQLSRHYYRDVIPLLGPTLIASVTAWTVGVLVIGTIVLIMALRACVD